jgi:hypothetical protein
MNINKYYTLAQSVNKFHYEIYTYTECKAQTIYTHNTGPKSWLLRKHPVINRVINNLFVNYWNFLKTC